MNCDFIGFLASGPPKRGAQIQFLFTIQVGKAHMFAAKISLLPLLVMALSKDKY